MGKPFIEICFALIFAQLSAFSGRILCKDFFHGLFAQIFCTDFLHRSSAHFFFVRFFVWISARFFARVF